MSTGVLESVGAVRACLFVLGGERFAIEVGTVREVVVVDEFTIVPRAPGYLIGVANLRGLILPILDIRPLLGLPPRPPGRGARVLVVEAGSGQVGVVLDEVVGLTAFAEVLPFGEEAPRAYRQVGVGLARHGDGLVTLLDAARVLQALKRTGGE
jgi:chemotaxis signal transduction protein